MKREKMKKELTEILSIERNEPVMSMEACQDELDSDLHGMNVEDVAWCSIHNWFPLYSKNSIKTRLITLPSEVPLHSF